MNIFRKLRESSRELLSEVRNKGLIKTVLALNFVDILTTLFLIYWFGGTELNPLMAMLIATHPVLFVIIKLMTLQLVIALTLWSEVNGGKAPALRFEGFKPILYFKEGHFVPRYVWIICISLFSLTLIFNLAMLLAGFFLF